MDPELPSAAPERVYDVTFPDYAGGTFNHDFRGPGSLSVEGEGDAATFTFRGRAQQAIGFGADHALTFTPAQIRNVIVAGERVEFATELGQSGRKRQPFVFLARTPEQAVEIARQLPAAKDAEFVAGNEFLDRLRHLPAPATRLGWVTNWIIGANIAVFIAMGLLGAGWLETADMLPYILYGANRADITTDGEWWRLIASTFLHYGIVHLLLNMWALLQTGHIVERLYGRTLYTVVYFGSGIAGSVATLLWHTKNLVWSAGASGAVFGVYGALIGYMLRERQALPKSVYQPLLKSSLAFAGYNLLFGLVHPNIDNAAHLGGLAGGALLGGLLALPLASASRAALVRRRLPLGLAVVAALVALGMAASPRFDYSLRDEIALQRVNRVPVAKEPDVLRREQEVVNAFTSGRDLESLPRWLADDAIAFYGQWREELLNLKLSPGRRSAQQRDRLAAFLERKIDAYQRLLAALRRGDAEAVPAFRADEKKIAESLEPARGHQ